MKILALDYDGVIANSQLECLAVGFNSYLKLNKKTKLFNGEKFTFKNFKNKINKNKAVIEKYKELRPYVIDAFCWYAILYIIENKIKIKNQNEYNNVRNKLIKHYTKYVEYFYNERSSLQKNFDKWLELLSPYKVVDLINKLGEKYIIAIATNNREKSIRPFLNKYKIPVKIITDSNISINKVKQLEFIKNKYNAKFSDICFVDDQVAHFPALLKLGVRCFLAAWGYNTKEQRNQAERIGVELLNEANFYERLK